jgi:hypothetical protein
MVEMSECAEKALVAYGVKSPVTWISRDVTLAMIRRLCSQSALVLAVMIYDLRDIGNDQARLGPALAHSFDTLDARLFFALFARTVESIAAHICVARSVSILAKRLGRCVSVRDLVVVPPHT